MENGAIIEGTDMNAGPNGEASRQEAKLDEELQRLNDLRSKLYAAVNELCTIQGNMDGAVCLYVKFREAKTSGGMDRMEIMKDCEEKLRQNERSVVVNDVSTEKAIKKIKDIRAEVNDETRWTQRVGGYQAAPEYFPPVIIPRLRKHKGSLCLRLPLMPSSHATLTRTSVTSVLLVANHSPFHTLFRLNSQLSPFPHNPTHASKAYIPSNPLLFQVRARSRVIVIPRSMKHRVPMDD